MKTTANSFQAIRNKFLSGSGFAGRNGLRIPIATKLILGFLLIIVITSVVFIAVGVQLIGDRIVSEAQEMVRRDLNAAREIYVSDLHRINNVIRFTADRFFIQDTLLSGNVKQAADELVKVKERERLDVLTLTDKEGNVLFRASNANLFGDNQRHDELVRAVLSSKQPVAGTTIVAADDLQKESPRLAEKAYFEFIDTPKARIRPETEETRGHDAEGSGPDI